MLIQIAIWLLRPVEVWHARRVERAYRSGKYHYRPDQGKPCVTTRRDKELV